MSFACKDNKIKEIDQQKNIYFFETYQKIDIIVKTMDNYVTKTMCRAANLAEPAHVTIINEAREGRSSLLASLAPQIIRGVNGYWPLPILPAEAA